MIEELPDDIEQDELDDIEPVGDENQLYEHFRVVVDKGQAMVRVDKYLFERIVNASRNRIFRRLPKMDLSWPTVSR